MTNNYTKLLINISRKAPWLIEKGKTFFTEKSPEDVKQALGNIRNCNLTIVPDHSRAFQQDLILRVKDDTLLIEKPCKWDDSIASFHVFFRSKDNNWDFIRVNGAKSDQTTVSAAIPDKIYLLQKRRFQRTLTPFGTRVLFRDPRNLIDSAFLCDISEGGMKIWTGSPKARLPINSIISDIFITLPTAEPGGKVNNLPRNPTYVTKGKIVRMYTDQASSTSHYGVSFIHKSICLYREFKSLITQLKNQATGISPEPE